MKLRLIMVLLSTTLLAYGQAPLDSVLTLSEKTLSLKIALDELSEKSGYPFSYSSRLPLQSKVTFTGTQGTLRHFLDRISKQLGIHYRVINGKVILTRSAQGANVPTRVTLSGYVTEASSKESLIGANVFERSSRSGTTTNAYGFYSVTLPTRQDSITLVYSYVGYAPQTITLLPRQDTLLNITLKDDALLDEVVVSALAEEIQEVTQMSAISVPIEQIKAAPALLGEVDVLKTLQLLPGVQSGNEGTSGLYVRGGGPDQNLILLDGVPVYNASHLFGFFSVFNADAINNVQLIKGGFPARYGGRLSSVIDINLKEGNMKEFHGEGSIGLIASKLTLEGPIIKDKTSFIVSGRRTYADLIARPIIQASAPEGEEQTLGYYFYDLNAKINHRFSDRDRLFLSAYLGDDHFYSRFVHQDEANGTLKSEDQIGLNWGNITSALRWNHVFGPKLFANTTLTYSRYRFSTTQKYNYEYLDDEQQKVSDQGTQQYLSSIKDYAAKLDFDYIPSPRHYVRFGANATHHTFRPGVLNVRYQNGDEVEQGTQLGSQATEAVETAAYVEDDWEITNRVKLNVGLHVSGFQVEDALYTSWQPRLAGRFLLNNQLSLKASYVQMAQFIHLLTNSGVGLPTDLWVPATSRIRPQQSHQWALGAARTWKQGYEVSLEGYYKTMSNLIEYKEGASFMNVNRDWQDKVATGDGRSYGAELLVQKKQGRTTGWLGYTLSWSNRQFDALNFGRRFPYKYDRRHDIGLAVMHQWKERVEVSFAWVFGTGNTITLPTAIYDRQGDTFDFNTDSQLYSYGERNGHRMRAYHRLDASITFRKPTRWGERAWVFGVYNAYSRRNPFYLYYTEFYSNFDEAGQFRQVSLFPIIPSVSYRFNF